MQNRYVKFRLTQRREISTGAVGSMHNNHAYAIVKWKPLIDYRIYMYIRFIFIFHTLHVTILKPQDEYATICLTLINITQQKYLGR